jgi:rhodanese-related sulfurtransferase
MGPLVPDIIGNELNLIVAIIIGFFFGMILEQAGFSTSKKLVGLFYGYDFTVLRVFFTAGVVAMFGVIVFDNFGILDINLIYINPTYLWAAIVGGLIMGLGFVIGGFCPGTSVCAAAIGKIDAMVFIGGSAIGVLVFAEGYPLFEGLYKAAFWGYPRIFDTLGVTQSSFAFLLALMAIMAFLGVSVIESKVNGVEKNLFHFSTYRSGLAFAGFVIAIAVLFLPDRKESLLHAESCSDINYVPDTKVMTVDELAYRIMHQDKDLQIFDFRTADEFNKFRLPASRSYTTNNLFEKEPGKLLLIKGKINVVVAEDEYAECKIAQIAKGLGFKNIYILQGGLPEFVNQIIEYKSVAVAGNQTALDTDRFRTKASQIIPQLIKDNKSAGPVKKTIKRALGGC